MAHACLSHKNTCHSCRCPHSCKNKKNTPCTNCCSSPSHHTCHTHSHSAEKRCTPKPAAHCLRRLENLEGIAHLVAKKVLQRACCLGSACTLPTPLSPKPYQRTHPSRTPPIGPRRQFPGDLAVAQCNLHVVFLFATSRHEPSCRTLTLLCFARLLAVEPFLLPFKQWAGLPGLSFSFSVFSSRSLLLQR